MRRGRLDVLTYERPAVGLRRHDPRVADVAAALAAAIGAVPGVSAVEHVGSTAVPGLAGKGIVDLMAVAAPGDVPAVTEGLVGLGFQRQTSPWAFPPDRPMLKGAVDHDGSRFHLHVHLVPADRSEVDELIGFRDALRADPALRARYVAEKEAVLAAGIRHGPAYADAKGVWVVETLVRLGLRPPAP